MDILMTVFNMNEEKERRVEDWQWRLRICEARTLEYSRLSNERKNQKATRDE